MDQGQVSQATPEKKLLKIIEDTGEGAADAKAAVRSSAVKKFNVSGIFSVSAIKARFSSLKNKFKSKLSPEAILSTDVRKINHLLMLATGVALVFFLINISTYRKSAHMDLGLLMKESTKTSGAASMMPRVSVSISETETLDSLLEKIKKRDYFKPIPKQQKKATAEKSSTQPSDIIDQATETLRLVGISFSPNPNDSYAMIEDTATRITYFVKSNQKILGVTISDIQRDKVILSLGDSEKELR
jgi:hypothetical protein